MNKSHFHSPTDLTMYECMRVPDPYSHMLQQQHVVNASLLAIMELFILPVIDDCMMPFKLLSQCFRSALQPSVLQASWDFMEQHGNTSGSSNLAILHHELTRSQPFFRDFILCLAGGPGTTFCYSGFVSVTMCALGKKAVVHAACCTVQCPSNAICRGFCTAIFLLFSNGRISRFLLDCRRVH